jgi:hypothetical protein
VVTSKGADAGNGDAHDGFTCYFGTPVADPLPSTAIRQRV